MRYVIGIPLGVLYIAFGTVVGLFLRYRTELHIRRFAKNPDSYKEGEGEHGLCWCYDNELPEFVKGWANHSWILWPVNLSFYLVIVPAFRYIVFPLFKFIVIPVFMKCVVTPIGKWKEYYQKMSSHAIERVRLEIEHGKEVAAKKLAEEADKKKHAKVDGAIARADELLKRVDNRVGGGYEE